MTRPSSLISSRQRFQSIRTPLKKRSSVTGVTDFLRAHEKMAALLPAVTRLVALQKECEAILPALFDRCSVMQFEAGNLILSAPNAAMATKLRQQLPNLQESLLKLAWQVNAIRIKVQVGKISDKKIPTKQLVLPPNAISALSSLQNALEESPHNQSLKAALHTMLRRHRKDRA